MKLDNAIGIFQTMVLNKGNSLDVLLKTQQIDPSDDGRFTISLSHSTLIVC
jgi:hypothetical protein